ncbi:MAG: hypothetical protein GX275_12795 [Clostridiales bacterium]|nr:hypothetical protein [Clostridiales bacterium]
MRKRVNCFIVTMIFFCQLFTIDITPWAEEKRNNNLSNDYIIVNLEDNKDSTEYLRFQVLTEKGNLKNSEDDSRKLMYSNFSSSYTTININEKSYIFGQGKTIDEPNYSKERSALICSQRFEDIVVTQELELVNGFTYGYEDMVKITYKVENLGDEDAFLGIRAMIDPFIGDDDKGLIEVDNEAIMAETEISKKDFHGVWQIESNNENIVAYGKASENNYDSITFANWDKLYDNRWNYEVKNSEVILDSAVAMTWNEEIIKAGENRKMEITYGVKNEIEDDDVLGDSELDTDNTDVLGTSEKSTGNSNYLLWVLPVVLSVAVIAVLVIRKVGGTKNG